jgi:hypothetical protein
MIDESSYDSSHISKINSSSSFLGNICGSVHFQSSLHQGNKKNTIAVLISKHMRVPTLWSRLVGTKTTHRRHQGCQSWSTYIHTLSLARAHTRYLTTLYRLKWKDDYAQWMGKDRGRIGYFKTGRILRHSLGITQEIQQPSVRITEVTVNRILGYPPETYVQPVVISLTSLSIILSDPQNITVVM